MSVMDGHKGKKLKWLLGTVPPGYLVDSKWLGAHGIGRRSSYDYVAAGWLERLCSGVFRRPIGPGSDGFTSVEWKSALLSAQRLMGYRFHLGGVTALHLAGHEHHLRIGGEETVWVYGDVPTWLEKIDLTAQLEKRTAGLFTDRELGLSPRVAEDSATPWWKQSLGTSEPERAVLEMLNELPSRLSFDSVGDTFESLGSLRPQLLTALLQDCRRVKVKRLFLVFAERSKHAWFNYLDSEAMDLGRGDRSLVKGGKLHSKYRITVPKGFLT